MNDFRHQKRAQLMQALYAADFHDQPWDVQEFDFSDGIIDEVKEILNKKDEYDNLISQYAPERSIEDMARIDLSILRLVLHESQTKETPKKVLINEGVELAKEYGSENAFGFVNAVLEKILLREQKTAEDQSQTELKEAEKNQSAQTKLAGKNADVFKEEEKNQSAQTNSQEKERSYVN